MGLLVDGSIPEKLKFQKSRATLENVAHRSGLFYQRRFEPTKDDNTHYDLKLGYASSHTYALDAVPRGATVLDIGPGPRTMRGARACRMVTRGTIIDGRYHAATGKR